MRRGTPPARRRAVARCSHARSPSRLARCSATHGSDRSASTTVVARSLPAPRRPGGTPPRRSTTGPRPVPARSIVGEVTHQRCERGEIAFQNACGVCSCDHRPSPRRRRGLTPSGSVRRRNAGSSVASCGANASCRVSTLLPVNCAPSAPLPSPPPRARSWNAPSEGRSLGRAAPVASRQGPSWRSHRPAAESTPGCRARRLNPGCPDARATSPDRLHRWSCGIPRCTCHHYGSTR